MLLHIEWLVAAAPAPFCAPGGACDCVLLEFRPATSYHLSACALAEGDEVLKDAVGEGVAIESHCSLVPCVATTSLPCHQAFASCSMCIHAW